MCPMQLWLRGCRPVQPWPGGAIGRVCAMGVALEECVLWEWRTEGVCYGCGVGRVCVMGVASGECALALPPEGCVTGAARGPFLMRAHLWVAE